MTGPFVGRMMRTLIWPLAAMGLLALPKLLTSGTSLTMLCLMGIAIVFALSYNMLLGETGLLSFGHAVYYGLGGFLAVHAMNAAVSSGWPLPLPAVPLVAGLTGLVFAVLFGWVSTRRSGTVFAMISLGLAELVGSCALILRGFFGGEEGITTNRTKLMKIDGWSFGSQLEVYYLIAGWCFVAALAMYALTRTPFGRLCNAVRDNAERAQFVGYNPQAVRYLAFCFAGFFAGIAGGLAAINFEIANAAYLGAHQSGTVLLATFIGGSGVFFGPIIGACLVTWLQASLSDVTEVWQLYFGLLFMAVVMFQPSGIAGLIMMHKPVWQAGGLLRLLPTYLALIPPALALLAGLVMVIEMTVRLMVKASDGPILSLAGITFNAKGLLPWLVALALLAAGGWGLRRLAPQVRAAWTRALGHPGVAAAISPASTGAAA
jgi:branched-chain amino acid transport system permease protein